MSRLTSRIVKSLLLGCTVLCLSSCQEKPRIEIPEFPGAELKDFTKTVLNKGTQDGKLVFNNVIDLEESIVALTGMTKDARSQWYADNNFTSLGQFYAQALDECSSFTFFEQYQLLREKYSPYFIFNDEASEDLMPYLKTSKTLYQVVLNKDGEVIIDNKTVSYNDLTSHSQTWFAKQEFGSKAVEVQKNNYLKVSTAKRKMWAEVATSSNVVFVILTAQVKSFWGWNHYRETYHTTLTSYRSNIVFHPQTMLSTERYKKVRTNMIPDNTPCILGEINFRRIAPTVGETAPMAMDYQIYANDMGSGEEGTLLMRIDPYRFNL